MTSQEEPLKSRVQLMKQKFEPPNKTSENNFSSNINNKTVFNGVKKVFPVDNTSKFGKQNNSVGLSEVRTDKIIAKPLVKRSPAFRCDKIILNTSRKSQLHVDDTDTKPLLSDDNKKSQRFKSGFIKPRLLSTPNNVTSNTFLKLKGSETDKLSQKREFIKKDTSSSNLMKSNIYVASQTREPYTNNLKWPILKHELQNSNNFQVPLKKTESVAKNAVLANVSCKNKNLKNKLFRSELVSKRKDIFENSDDLQAPLQDSKFVEKDKPIVLTDVLNKNTKLENKLFRSELVSKRKDIFENSSVKEEVTKTQYNYEKIKPNCHSPVVTQSGFDESAKANMKPLSNKTIVRKKNLNTIVEENILLSPLPKGPPPKKPPRTFAHSFIFQEEQQNVHANALPLCDKFHSWEGTKLLHQTAGNDSKMKLKKFENILTDPKKPPRTFAHGIISQKEQKNVHINSLPCYDKIQGEKRCELVDQTSKNESKIKLKKLENILNDHIAGHITAPKFQAMAKSHESKKVITFNRENNEKCSGKKFQNLQLKPHSPDFSETLTLCFKNLLPNQSYERIPVRQSEFYIDLEPIYAEPIKKHKNYQVQCTDSSGRRYTGKAGQSNDLLKGAGNLTSSIDQKAQTENIYEEPIIPSQERACSVENKTFLTFGKLGGKVLKSKSTPNLLDIK